MVGEAFAIAHAASRVCAGRLLNGCNTTSHPSKAFGCIGGDEVVDKAPSLDEDVVTRNERLVRGQQLFCPAILPVASVSRGIPGRAVHEDTHDAAEWRSFPAAVASPIIRSFSGSDIRCSRRTKIEDDGTVKFVGTRPSPDHQSAHIFGK